MATILVKKIYLLIVPLLLLNSCDKPVSTGYIDADDPLIIYEGRFDFTNPKSPRFDWPGTSIHAVFEGSKISVKLTDGNNDYNVLLTEDLKQLSAVTAILFIISRTVFRRECTELQLQKEQKVSLVSPRLKDL